MHTDIPRLRKGKVGAQVCPLSLFLCLHSWSVGKSVSQSSQSAVTLGIKPFTMALKMSQIQITTVQSSYTKKSCALNNKEWHSANCMRQAGIVKPHKVPFE